MQRFEYKVVPAPRKGEKVRGAKTLPDRFALTLTQMMNELGRDGWEYLRADTLPCEERVGFTGKATSFQNMLVFRRALAVAEVAPLAPRPAETPAPVAAPVAHVPPPVAAPVAHVAPPVAPPAPVEPVPAFFNRTEEPEPDALAATLSPRPADAEPPRAPAVAAPLGAAPSLGPARGNGVAAE